jgi:hypothetical protein
MRQLKAAGLIDRFPNGERKHSLPPLSKNPIIRKAQRKLEERKAQMARGVIVVPAQETKAEKLGEATDIGLDRVLEFLRQEIDAEANPKLFALQISTALSAISNQVKLDSAVLSAASGGLAALGDADLDARLDRLADRIDRIELPGDEIEGDMLPDEDVSDVPGDDVESGAEAAE